MLIRAKYNSVCVRCAKPLFLGTVIDYDPLRGSTCESCHRLIAEVEHSAYRNGTDILRACGERSGPVWNAAYLQSATNYGIVSQFYDNGYMNVVERFKMGPTTLCVQTVYFGEGNRVSYLWGPAEHIAIATNGGVKISPKPKPIPKKKAAPIPTPKVTTVAAFTPRPVVEDLMFKTPPPPKLDLPETIIVQLDIKSGLFWTQIAAPPKGEEARQALRRAGFLFHYGRANGEEKHCSRGCEACAAQLRALSWYTRSTAAARVFAQYLTPEARQAAGVPDNEPPKEIPCPAGRTYYPYQIEGIRWCLDRRSVLLADEPGLGKTIQVFGLLNTDDSIKKVLVLAPASLVLNWRDEAKRWLMRPMHVVMLSDSSQMPKDRDRILTVTNYEMLIRGRGHNLLKAVSNKAWDLIVMDEAHKLSNQREAQIAKAVLGIPADRRTMNPDIPGLISRSARKVMLTGTPIRNRPRELWSLVHALDPQHFDNESHFLTRYCMGGKSKRSFDGAAYLEELHDRLKSKSNGGKGLMLRRLKANVLPDLPPKTRQIVSLPVPRSALRLVNRELKEFQPDEQSVEAARANADMLALRGLQEEYSKAVSRLHSAGSVAFRRMARIRHEVGLAKAPVVVEHVRNALDGGVECLLLFAHHRDVIEHLMKGLRDYKPIKITGAESKIDRHEAVNIFQNDSSCRVAVCNIAAAGIGITLSRASLVDFAELSFVPGEMVQAEDRAHRIGQISAVIVEQLVFDGSLDQRMVEILVEKMSISDMALDARSESDLPSAKLKEAAERRCRISYTEDERAEIHGRISAVNDWPSQWSAVGSWLGSLTILNDPQAELAERCLKFR